MRVIVVGGGIHGLSAAWALVKRGVAVTLLEQGEIPNPLGASGDEHRIIRRAYGTMTGYQRRIGEAYEAWAELWEDLGRSHLVATGYLLVSQTPGDEAEVMRDGLAAAGHAYEEMSGHEAAARWPFLDPAGLRFVAFSAEGGVLLCREIARGLRDWLRAGGAELREGARVTAIDAAGGRVSLAGGEGLEADALLIAAGAWAPGLVPALADRLVPYRTYVGYYRPPEDFRAAWARAPVILDIGGAPDGYLLPPVAGTGLKFGAGAVKRRGPPDRDRAPAPGEGERLRALFAPPLARIEEYALDRVVTCAYTFTADQHFLVETTGRATVISACSGHGYKFGAAVGRRLAAGLAGGDMAAAHAWIEARD